MDEEFSGDGDESEFFGFSACEEVLVDRNENWVETRGSEGSHVEDAPYLGSAAMDETFF